MPISGGQSLSLSDIARDVRRNKEGMTLAISQALDNDAVYVTVANISGRGVLESIGVSGDGSADVLVTTSINIDGAGATEYATHFKIPSGGAGVGLPLALGFQTSCVVQMKLDGSSVCRFTVVTNVE